ncbi:hypothetical protein R0J90_20095, partial [Micrococcus sp. SIMBA_144]
DHTSLEVVKEQIMNLSSQDLHEQLNLIRLSVETNAIVGSEVSEAECKETNHPFIKTNHHETFLETAEEIGDFLVEQAILDKDG